MSTAIVNPQKVNFVFWVIVNFQKHRTAGSRKVNSHFCRSRGCGVGGRAGPRAPPWTAGGWGRLAVCYGSKPVRFATVVRGLDQRSLWARHAPSYRREEYGNVRERNAHRYRSERYRRRTAGSVLAVRRCRWPGEGRQEDGAESD